MHLSAPHRDGLLPDRIFNAGPFHSFPPPVAHSQVDGPPTFEACLPGVIAEFKYIYLVSAFGKQYGPKRAHEPGANNEDAIFHKGLVLSPKT
jgi:hypothetical protein